jgi:general L-amino acid transport system substrate-binding protein
LLWVIGASSIIRDDAADHRKLHTYSQDLGGTGMLKSIQRVAFGLTAAAALVGGANAQQVDTVGAIKARGQLNCGVSTGVQTGMSTLDASGNWAGFEVDFCRGLAAAILGDADKVKYVPLDIKTAFTTLQSGGIDLLARTATETFLRDVEMNLAWAGAYLYDSQGFLARKSLGVESALELDGASICVSAGSNYEQNLSDYFRNNSLSFTPVAANSRDQNEKNLIEGRCDVYANVLSALAGARSKMPNQDEWVVLPEMISMEPIGPVVRQDDYRFQDVVSWVLNAQIAAEEYGVTSKNATEMRDTSPSPEVQRLLGKTGDFGAKLGLGNDWALNTIQAVGNYGEMFSRHLGEESPIKLERRLNALWKDGGLLYTPLIR